MSDETYKMRRFDFYPDDWLAGTMNLTLEEEAVYLRICLLIMSCGGAINNHDPWLAGMCRVSTRKWSKLRQMLIDKDKITIVDGLIHVNRCRKELEKYAKMVRKRAESGSKGGRTTAERYKSPNENNTVSQASATATLKPARATPSPSPSPSPKTSKSYAFAGRVIRLNDGDFKRWSEAYRAIPDLRALLQSRDDWLATEASEDDQRRWFISTSNYLAKQNTRALAERAASQDDEYDPDFIN